MEQEKKTSSNRGKGRGRGRGRKKTVDPEKIREESVGANHEEKSNEQEAITLDLDADITQLEAPTFSTINKGPPEPMLRLNWDHKTHLIGEKVINPMIHCCDKCEAPILIYGRMIPCKHVFCLTCAERECKTCPRCQEKVVRIERTGLGTVFLCTFGGTRYGNSGCRRTYLSQRDLLAHINHRHVVGTASNKESLNNSQATTPSPKAVPAVSSRSKPLGTHHVAVAGDPRIQTGSNHEYLYKMHSPSSHTSSSSQSSHRQTSHHHSVSHHHSELHPITTQSSSHNILHSSAVTGHQTSLRHLAVSTSQQLISPTDFVNQMMIPNYPPPTPNSVATLPSVRSNLITIQTHDSNADSGNSSVGISLTSNFHQTYSTQFTPSSSSGIPFPVPPPGHSGINALPQTPSQYYPNAPINFALTSSQRPAATQFSPNSPGQSIMNQSQMIPGPPQMVPAPRRTQFPRDNAIQQFSVTPAHRWHQPNQTQFY